MLTTALVQEVDRLLREGELSQRQIASHLCVSRGTISAIASGRRGLHGRDTPLCTLSHALSTPTRCRTCGYRVYLPCLICRIRTRQHQQRLLKLLATRRPQKTAPRRHHLRAS